MTNAWLHSLGVVAVAALAIAVAHACAYRIVAEGNAHAWFEAPLFALASLVPGLVLGWYTRRHPLVVGAIAGLLGLAACQQVVAAPSSRSPIGDLLAAGLVVAVAALAGRALRFRFAAKPRGNA